MAIVKHAKKLSRQDPAASLPPALLPVGGGVGGRVLRGEAGNQNTGEHLWHLSWETGRVCSSVKAAEEDEAVRGEKAAPPVGLILWLSQRPRRRGLRFLCGNEVPAWRDGITPVTAVFRRALQDAWPYRREEVVSCVSGWL